LPAFVAFFVRVTILAMPGTITLPVFFTCAATTSERAVKTLEQSPFFNSVAAEMASARPPFVMLFEPFLATIAFIAFMDFIDFMGAIVEPVKNKPSALKAMVARKGSKSITKGGYQAGRVSWALSVC